MAALFQREDSFGLDHSYPFELNIDGPASFSFLESDYTNLDLLDSNDVGEASTEAEVESVCAALPVDSVFDQYRSIEMSNFCADFNLNHCVNCLVLSYYARAPGVIYDPEGRAFEANKKFPGVELRLKLPTFDTFVFAKVHETGKVRLTGAKSTIMAEEAVKECTRVVSAAMRRAISCMDDRLLPEDFGASYFAGDFNVTNLTCTAKLDFEIDLAMLMERCPGKFMWAGSNATKSEALKVLYDAGVKGPHVKFWKTGTVQVMGGKSEAGVLDALSSLFMQVEDYKSEVPKGGNKKAKRKRVQSGEVDESVANKAKRQTVILPSELSLVTTETVRVADEFVTNVADSVAYHHEGGLANRPEVTFDILKLSGG
mmetsp:Transcript_40595/g.105377  ORF Transcript_40595/g.105377 Transcript_40595/m.105377 type:complete len:371 (-) Transcript_40595:59-1171(-)